MLDIHRKAILRALGLNRDSTPDSFRVDPKNTHGIRRNRFYFRNYQDCVKVSKAVVLESSDIEGPLLDFEGHPIPLGPLLRVRSVLGHNVYQHTNQFLLYGTTSSGEIKLNFNSKPKCIPVT